MNFLTMNNIDLITWLADNVVSIIALIVAIISLWFSIKTQKQNKKNRQEDIKQEIARKEAQLRGLETIHNGIDITTLGNIMAERAKLSMEIEQFKKML